MVYPLLMVPKKPIDGFYDFYAFTNQGSLYLNELSSTENITLKIYEDDIPNIENFDDSKISIRGITTTEMEVIHTGGKARVRSVGSGNPPSFEFVIPVTVNQTPVKDNNILDLPDTDNSILFIMYSSPWSSRSIIDTLYLVNVN